MSKINFLIMFYLVQLSKSFLTKEIHNPISRKITRTMSGKLNSKQKIYNFEKNIQQGVKDKLDIRNHFMIKILIF